MQDVLRLLDCDDRDDGSADDNTYDDDDVYIPPTDGMVRNQFFSLCDMGWAPVSND